eukprot:10881690-Prorocentrum_lima.AAC.1
MTKKDLMWIAEVIDADYKPSQAKGMMAKAVESKLKQLEEKKIISTTSSSSSNTLEEITSSTPSIQ